jgi:hypothetical protein
MSFNGLLTQTAIITSRVQTGSPDDRNLPTWNVAVTQGIRCYIEQHQVSEDTVDRETQLQTIKGYFPAGIELDGSDEVEVDGVTYEVLGPSDPVWNPRTSTFHHVEATLREVQP